MGRVTSEHGPERLRICEIIYRRCTWRFTVLTCSDRLPETGRFVCFQTSDFYPVTGFSKADRVPIPCVVFAILISPPRHGFVYTCTRLVERRNHTTTNNSLDCLTIPIRYHCHLVINTRFCCCYCYYYCDGISRNTFCFRIAQKARRAKLNSYSVQWSTSLSFPS